MPDGKEGPVHAAKYCRFPWFGEISRQPCPGGHIRPGQGQYPESVIPPAGRKFLKPRPQIFPVFRYIRDSLFRQGKAQFLRRLSRLFTDLKKMSALCVSLVPVYGTPRKRLDSLAQRFIQSRKYEALSATKASACSLSHGKRV